MKHLIFWILGLSVAMLLGYGIGRQHERRVEAEQALADLQVGTFAPPESNVAAPTSGTTPAATPWKGKDAEGGPDTEAYGKKNDAGQKNPLRELAKTFMQDPGMRDMIKQQAKKGIAPQYRDLFELLGLDQEKQDAVLKILADRQDVMMDAGLGIMDNANLDQVARDEKAARIQQATADASAQLKEVLGQEDFAKFEKYEDSAAERMELQMFSSSLARSGAALDEATETRLMDAMYEERQQFKFDRDLSRKDGDPGSLDSATIDTYLRQRGELRDKISARAGQILTPDQLAVFKESQARQAKMEKVGLQMSKSFFGGDK